MARLERSKWSNKLTMVAHHVIAGSGGIQTLIAQRGMSCFCAMIATEWSTMFLNMVLFTRHPNYKAWVKKYMPWLQLLSGFCLWCVCLPSKWHRWMVSQGDIVSLMISLGWLLSPLFSCIHWCDFCAHPLIHSVPQLPRTSFILFRLLLVPYIIYRWVSDHISGHPSARQFSNFEIYWAISGSIFICFLSYAWFFVKIHKGFMNSVSACWKKKASSWVVRSVDGYLWNTLPAHVDICFGMATAYPPHGRDEHNYTRNV